MRIIAKGRGMGKTSDLIIMSVNTGDYIVVKDHNTAINTANQARELGFNINFPLTFQEFLNHEWNGKRISGFLIDDAEFLLLQFFSNEMPPIHALTFTMETEKVWITPIGSTAVRIYGTIIEHRMIIDIEADIDLRHDGRWHWEVHNGLYSGFSKTEDLARKRAIKALNKHYDLLKGEEK